MANKQNAVIDTNIFMESVDVLIKLIDEYNVIVPLVVLEELDNLKDSHNDIRTHKARHAIKFINTKFDNFTFDEVEREGKPDNQIIQSAVDNNAILVTNDVCVKVKCKSKNIETIGFIGNIQDFKGYTILELDTGDEEDNKILSKLYEKPEENTFGLHINEYIIIRDKANPIFDENNKNIGYKTMDIMRWNGVSYVKLTHPPKKVIKPLNDLQTCALDLLNNKDIPIKIIAGCHGSGKTLLATSIGLHMVEDKGNYSKLVLVRNNDMCDFKDIGALPGTLEDKTGLLFKTMTQHFPQGEYQAEKMEMEGKLEYHIPYYMKGLSISGFMIFDEAEDSSLKQIKQIGSRIEKDGCICVVGDWKQTSGKYLADNGMVQLIEQTKDESLVGVIVLDLDVRSEASRVFAELI